MKNLPFTKMVCGGNDFIIVDHRTKPLPDIEPVDIAKLCNRSDGIGADGLIYLVDSEEHPFGIKLFNADGSFAEVSYNGSRCVALFAVEKNICSSEFSFGSDAGEIKVRVSDNEVLLHVPPPRSFEHDLELDSEKIPAHFIEAGVPYLVLFTDQVAAAKAVSVATSLKTHPYFPAGTNVAVSSPPAGSVCSARFFERGVDEETDSSGTGCVAVALLAEHRYGLSSPITIHSAGGDFEIIFAGENDDYYDISTAGEVKKLLEGTINL